MRSSASLNQTTPGFFALDTADLQSVHRHLRERSLLQQGELITEISPAGSGNMNLTLRVTTDRRTMIIKQAYPWVAKYPQIAAPFDRALIEGEFYRRISAVPELARQMPKLLGIDPTSRILAFEDLGEAKDLTSIYRGKQLSQPALQSILNYLDLLHTSFVEAPWATHLANRAMRRLNHEHIFAFPLQQTNGFDLDAITPGLNKIAQSLRNNSAYVTKTNQLGELYLQDGLYLLHGDYFPGSWLQTDHGIKIIDPEFGFLVLVSSITEYYWGTYCYPLKMNWVYKSSIMSQQLVSTIYWC